MAPACFHTGGYYLFLSSLARISGQRNNSASTGGIGAAVMAAHDQIHDQIDVSTPAVVLKFDPNVMHHGGLGVIRSLGRAGISVYGVHEDGLAPAASSRYLRGRLFWRPDPADVDRVLRGLDRKSTR